MKRISIVVAFVILSSMPVIVVAQQQDDALCHQKLRLARSVYENGRLHELKGLIEGCLNSNVFTTQERIDAFKLLTLASIYLEEPEEADKMMLNILNTDPEFEPNLDIDPAEFVALYHTFRTEPVYRLGVKVGGNATQPNVHQYSPLNEGTEKYSYGFGFQAGVTGEVAIFNDKLTLNPELYFTQRSFSAENTFFEGDQVTTGKVSISWISLPVSVQYPLPFVKKTGSPLTPYISGGISVDYLLSTKSKLETAITDQSPVSTSGTEKAQYKAFNLAPIASVGAKIKVKKAELVGEIRYNFGASTIFRKDKVYDNPKEIFGNKFIHGPFSLNTVSISFGYLFNKYIPKKKNTH